MAFYVVNDKTFPEYEVEKIFQIRQAVQKLWPNFNLYVNVMQKHAIHVKCMYILSLSFGLSIHNSVNSWPNHFTISKVVVDKRTSGWRSIMSTIYLNWNITVIYCRIKIKLVSVKAEWWWVLFRKSYFLKSLPVSQSWRHLTFNCGYLSYFTFE